MPHPDWEDLSDFFDPDEFATKAIITRGAEAVAEVFGIFDDPTDVASLGEFELEHPNPRFVCAEVEVSLVHAKDVVTIEGKAFDLMRAPELDGTGLAVLHLATPNVIHDAGL
ncbi:Phage Head-Tail Attachment [Pelagimonas phthalicica]|uniref:Phage Head-Tail Attachment n=1 Tax=Pelagimonas phthalicica TaxID=1037362 RepID=A0A238J9G0_9RHOB|nr:head-tail joining protein [Pelagimonas phthalicica]TDS94187.1 phage head-tail attachment protein [Pelagimonas phthalicica]SMX27288.1 Phage Head-Tail Attachment [Pelagimonas phthalicica]